MPYNLFYLFYLTDGNSAELYAYTTDKKIAKRFKNERNMEKFIYDKKKITMEDASTLLNPGNRLMISDFDFYHEDNKVNTDYAITYNEYLNIRKKIKDVSMYIVTSKLPYRICSKELRKALIDCGYETSMFALDVGDTGVDYFKSDDVIPAEAATIDGYTKDKDKTEYYNKHMEVDVLRIFIEMVGETLKI